MFGLEDIAKPQVLIFIAGNDCSTAHWQPLATLPNPNIMFKAEATVFSSHMKVVWTLVSDLSAPGLWFSRHLSFGELLFAYVWITPKQDCSSLCGDW
jgi:hypothetical protein